MKRSLFLVSLMVAFSSKASESPWQLVDNFEANQLSPLWTNIDTQNETDPFAPHPQITALVRDVTGNQYLLKKPLQTALLVIEKRLVLDNCPHQFLWARYIRYTRA